MMMPAMFVQMDTTIELVKTFGWPGAILIVMGFAAWRMIKWVKPLGEKLVSAHVSFVEKAANDLTEHGTKLDMVVSSNRETCDAVKELTVAVRERAAG